MSRGVSTALAGIATFVVAGGAMWLGLGVAPLVAGGLGGVLAVGMGLMTLPGGARKLAPIATHPQSTDQYLDASRDSADAMDKQMGRLTSRTLWSASGLDERIREMVAAVRTLAGQPALRARERSDGDVQTLFRVATDYLPTLVNLAIENDRMHSSFRSRGSHESVERNVAALDEQSAILAEAIERIEVDVVEGASRDAAQHAAFLHSRFAQASTPALLDLDSPSPNGDPS